MVESKSRRRLYFAAFLLPCLLLYTLFFIYPFCNGLYISLTNWDGLTPKSPISMNAAQFENDILGKLKKQSDKDYLLSVYTKNAADDTYTRLSLGGLKRGRVESIFKKAGYTPESYRFVGLKNYADILGGKVKETFYPRSYVKSYYNISSGLPATIAKKDIERSFLAKLSPVQRDMFDTFYIDDGDSYSFNTTYNESDFEDQIWLIHEVNDTGAISSDEVDKLVGTIKQASIDRKLDVMDAAVDAFIAKYNLSTNSIMAVRAGANGIYSLGDLKVLMARKWVDKGFDLGVIGFTAFFTIFSVIGINLLAFLLALALDSGIRGQKFLRSIFFLPNVLSMIIVALIWKMLFFQMFPRLTGIDQWLSDPVKTPWLIVLVAVWQGAGYYMIVYLAGLQNIPTDVVEASTIDGANAWQRFRSITLPLLVPAITISLFLTIANALKSFDLVYAMTSGSGYTYGTVPVVLDIFFDAFSRKQAGLATAKAMLLFIIIFAVTGLQLFVMKKKEIEQ